MSYPNVEALLGNTKPVNDKDPLIGLERGVGIVLDLQTFQHPDKGFGAALRLLVVESSGPEAHPAGTIVKSLWFIEQRPEFKTQTSDADRFADFIMKICDCNDPVRVQKWGGDLLVHRVGDQLLRGMFVKFEGVNRRSAKGMAAGKPAYVVPNWSNVPQTPEQIAQTRAKIDATHPLQLRVQQQVTAPQYAPAPQYQQQPQYATQPQYAPQMQQPMYAPQPAPAPQYQPQPMYAPQVQPAPAAPAAQPQGAPPGYPMPPGYGR